MNKQDLMRETCALVDSMQADLLGISHYIFDHPELCFKEEKSAACLESYAVKNGFTVTRGEGELHTAMKGVKPPVEGLNIAFLSEFDALPIGHACGHNLIAASGIGAAVAFDKIARKYGLPANAIFLGTPAEEGGGGKIKMLDAGFFEGVDYAMMIHPADRTMVEDWSMACQTVNIRFHGKSAHCAASPWLGANALAAGQETMNMINAWRCQFKDYSRVHGIIRSGGEAPNVMPDFCEIEYLVRSEHRAYMDELVQILLRCAKCAAEAFGVTMDYSLSLAYDPINNDPALEQNMKVGFEYVGETVMPRMRTHGIGSTDMGNVSQHVKAIHGHLKLAELHTHTEAFMREAGGESGEKYVMIAAKAMALTALGLVVKD